MLKFFKKRLGRLLGIDIDSTSIKIVELSCVESNYCLEAYATVPLPDGAVNEQRDRHAEGVAEAIQRTIIKASSSGATSTSFKQAALSLEVTPYITPDNRILMEVRVTKDAPDFQKAINGVPPIDKNELSAKVLVVDGETIVIGGVFQKVQKESLEKEPVLGDIPGLKGLFRRKMRRDDKTELLVFITPRIMNNQSISLNR